MNQRIVLWSSLAFSAILGMVLLGSNPHETPQNQDAAAMAALQASYGTNSHHDSATNLQISAVNPATNSVSAVTWNDLESTNLTDYVARLRSVNCPEETIKDLLLAAVERVYGRRQMEISMGYMDDQRGNYWKPMARGINPEKQKKYAELNKLQMAMGKEKSALLMQLFGVDVEKERMMAEGFDVSMFDWQSGKQLSYLPESKREQVAKYLQEAQEKTQAMYAEIGRNWDAVARAKQRAMEQETFDGLAKILSPQELREYELRNSQTANQLSSEIKDLDITRQQYEAMYDIRNRYGDSIYNYGNDNNSPETIKQIELNKTNMQAELTSVLGASKGRELELQNDYNYQQLKGIESHYELPPDTASKVYDYKDQVQKAQNQINSNPDLTPEQKQAALTQISTETQAAVKAVLGDKAYNRYKNRGGYWLNNIAPRRPVGVPVK